MIVAPLLTSLMTLTSVEGDAEFRYLAAYLLVSYIQSIVAHTKSCYTTLVFKVQSQGIAI